MFPVRADWLYCAVMDWTPTRIIALFLALWVALAPAVFAAPAAAMTLQMSMASDPDSAGCDSCPDAKANRGICALMCVNAFLFAATAKHGNLVLIAVRDDHPLKRDLALSGRTVAPDPPPPKSVALR